VTYRNLGRTGVQVSPICLGAMNFGGPTSEEDSVRIVDAAVDGGINFIDTANVYNAGESERIVGQRSSRTAGVTRSSWRPRRTARWGLDPMTRATAATT
jgi:aryl-alcohol dehydrogenase-like predicted oxidoreductase